jgi:hypothetical protein
MTDESSIGTDTELYAVAIVRALVEPMDAARKQGKTGTIELGDDVIADRSQHIAGLFLDVHARYGDEGVANLILRLAHMAAAFLMGSTGGTAGRDPLDVLDHWEFRQLTQD